MNAQTSKPDLRLRSVLEELVIEELSQLPAGYELNLQPERILIDVGEERRKYKPGIEVTSPTGFRLIVEVVSVAALSIANRFWLLNINDHVRKTGAAFMVLVPDANRKKPFRSLIPELQSLPLTFAYERADIVPAVLDALEQSARQKAVRG